MSYVPSLGGMILSKMTIDMHSDPEMKALERKINVAMVYQRPDIMQKVGEQREALIHKKVTDMGLPPLLRKELVALVRFRTEQVKSWWERHNDAMYPFPKYDLESHFCWKPDGTIDDYETTKSIILIEGLGCRRRVHLARKFDLGHEAMVIHRLEIDRREREQGLPKMKFRRSQLTNCWERC